MKNPEYYNETDSESENEIDLEDIHEIEIGMSDTQDEENLNILDSMTKRKRSNTLEVSKNSRFGLRTTKEDEQDIESPNTLLGRIRIQRRNYI